MSVWSAAQARACFPLLTQQPELIWLDSAATTQKPLAVLDAERAFYEQINANVHRGAHRLGHAATEAFEAARTTVAHFINSPSRQQLVFTRGATEAINLVAQSWGGSQLQPGDEILISMLEHHADIVPWQMLAARTAPSSSRYRSPASSNLIWPRWPLCLAPEPDWCALLQCPMCWARARRCRRSSRWRMRRGRGCWSMRRRHWRMPRLMCRR